MNRILKAGTSRHHNRLIALSACALLSAGLMSMGMTLTASAHVIPQGGVQVNCEAVPATVTVTVTSWAGNIEITRTSPLPVKVTEHAPTLDLSGAGSATMFVADIGGNGSYTAGRQGFPTDPIPVEFTVDCAKAQPSIGTDPSDGGVIGTVIHDTATMSGGSSLTGNVTFRLYAPGDTTCAHALSLPDPTEPLSGLTATSDSYTTAAVGIYRWTATYNGDINNEKATSGCQAELVTTTKAQPEIGTDPSDGGVIGTVIHDTATMSGGSSPTGNVTFRLYAPGDTTCAHALSLPDPTEPLSGLTATSDSYTTAAVGIYRWTATYNGDINNEKATSGCQAELVTTVRDHPSIDTNQSDGGVIGTAIHDTATVSDGHSPTGNVTFRLYAPGDTGCDTDPVFTDTETLSGGVATSIDYTTAAVGKYRWTATYNGDPNNETAVSDCQAEQVTTVKARPEISTKQSDGGPIGIAIHDTATVGGGYSPAGNVTFRLYAPGDTGCDSDPVFTDTETLSGGVATSIDYTTAAVGTYRWKATYNGDDNNFTATSGCQAEKVIIVQAQPKIGTAPSDGGVIGTAIHDTATVSGGHGPTGTVTFKLYAPSDASCANGAVFTDANVTLTGLSATSGNYTTVAVGTYRWTATYNGDTNNLPASSGCQAEQVTVNAPSSGTLSASTGGVLAATTAQPNTGHADLFRSLMLALALMILGIAVLVRQTFFGPKERRQG